MTRLLLALASTLLAGVALAQPTSPATPSPVGVAADASGYSIDLNPALLPFVPRYSLVASHVRTVGRDDERIATNVAAAFAMRGFGFGLGFDRLDAATGSRGRFSFAMGYAPSRRFSLGMALRVVGPNGSLAGGNGLDLAAAIRPSRFLAFSLVATDLLGPVGLDGNRAVDTPTRFGGYVAYRPFGSLHLTLEGGFLVATDGELSTRLFASSAFSDAARAYVVGRVDDLTGASAFSLLAGIEVRLGGLGVGGALTVDRDGASGFGVFASVDGRAANGFVDRTRVLKIELEGSTSARQLVRVLLSLDHARIDPRTDGAVVYLRESGIGLAGAQELRHAIALLVSGDEPVTCVLESPTGAELYACGAATETYVEESGTVRLLGPSVDLVTFGGLFETLGVHADFVRIGAYKSAPERFTNREPSAESIAQTTTFVDDAYERLVYDLSTDLSVPRRVIRDAIDRGPLTPREAESVGFVDGSIDTVDVEDAVHRLHGHDLPIEADARPVDPTWGIAPRVAVVLIDGPIVDRESVSIPFLGSRATGADTIVATLESLRRDATVRSVVIRVDSPGGSASGSERIWRAIRRLAEHKPVVASLGSIAASGGYYVATAASAIYADPSTLTGSIGIYFGKVDVATLAHRLGVGVASIERGEHAGATSMYRPFDDEERARVEVLVREGYDLFLRRVAEGRHRSVESLDGLCEGRIWSGDRAREHGLVDRIGGLVAAIAQARVLGDVPDEVDVVVLPEVHVGLVERMLGGQMATPAIPLARMASLAWLVHGPSEGMLALSPFDEGVR